MVLQNVDKDNRLSLLLLYLSPLVDISLTGWETMIILAKNSFPMAKLTSIKYSKTGLHVCLFLLRAGLGIMMLTHGLPKLLHYNKMAPDFFDPFKVSSHLALGLVVFSEVICSVSLIVGLFTRAFVIPLIIQMAVIIFIVHAADGFSRQELALHYLLGYVILLIIGAGRFSLDGMLTPKRNLTKY